MENKSTIIRHICMPGGGHIGLNIIGALQYLNSINFWDIEDIENIYCVSVSSIIAVLISLRFSWEDINDYIIKCPFHQTYSIDIEQIINLYSKKGLMGEEFFITFIKPFFNAKDLSLDITMLQLYEITKINIHIMVYELNKNELQIINHLTFPNLKVLTALQMSSAIPILFTPVYYENGCYVDGGILCNYPIMECMNDVNNLDEILAIYNNYTNEEDFSINNNDDIISYVIKIVVNVLSKNIVKGGIKNEIAINVDNMMFEDINNVFCSSEYRLKLLEQGINDAKMFMAKENEEKIKEEE